MTKTEILKQINELSKKFYKEEEFEKYKIIFEKIEKIITNYLLKHPHDSEMWLRLAMLEFSPGWEDPYRIEKYLNEILIYDPQNTTAVFILAYIQSLFWAEIPNSTRNRISCLKNHPLEVESLIHLAKSWCYQETDPSQQEKLLINSIALHDEYVSNYKDLAELYIKQGRIPEAIPMLQKAIDNVQKVSGTVIDKNEDPDLTAIEPFINTWIKQIHISHFSLKNMKDTLKKYLTEDNSNLFN